VYKGGLAGESDSSKWLPTTPWRVHDRVCITQGSAERLTSREKKRVNEASQKPKSTKKSARKRNEIGVMANTKKPPSSIRTAKTASEGAKSSGEYHTLAAVT